MRQNTFLLMQVCDIKVGINKRCICKVFQQEVIQFFSFTLIFFSRVVTYKLEFW